jgi:hypothetical protein
MPGFSPCLSCPVPNRPDLHRTFGPSLVSRITSYLVEIAVEETAQPSLNGTGQSPYMTQGHLESAYDGGLVPAPDFSPGERVFQTRGIARYINFGAFRVCVRARKAMCRPSGTRLLLLTLPGTDVPGYRLSRPYWTASLRPVNNTAITPLSYVFSSSRFSYEALG